MPQQKDKQKGKKRPDGWKILGKGALDLEEKTMPMHRSGYSELNDVDWIYLI